MASYADNCNVNSAFQTSSCPATPTRGIGRFGTPKTVFSPAAYSPVKPAACNGDAEVCCSSVLLKSVRPLLEKLAMHMHASSSQGLADGQHKPIKSYVADAPDVKRPGIGRFGGKPAATVLAPVVVNAAPVTPSAVVAPVVVPEVAPVAPVASTTPQVPEASVTTETISEEARVADPSEKARWSKLRQEVRAMDNAMTRAAYLRWDKLSKETSWAMEIEAAIEASLRGNNGCSSKEIRAGVKGAKGTSTHAGSAPCAASSVRAAGKASSRHVSGVKRREGGGCGEGAAGRAAGGRQGGVKAAGGRAVANGVCGREGLEQQAGRREGLVHERQARPGCSSSRAHRRSS
ncbi:unnamed protein product [Closterium sp. Naga37s-1]|nr:unnamed protein product [Closterium sp. Naga37s-1]